MKQYRRTDGKDVRPYIYWGGKVYLNPERVVIKGRPYRGGPDYPQHICVFEDWMLEGGEKRCKKCGLVKET